MLLAAAAAATASCQDPTQVRLELSTDVPCSQVEDTSITAGDASALESGQPSAVTTACDASTGRIGSLVLVPSGEKDARVRVRVVTGVKKSAEACVRDGYEALPGEKGGCIVAYRDVGFSEHSTLVLPIRMSLDCLNKVCGAGETCSAGKCQKTTCLEPSCTTAGDGGPQDGSDAGAGSDASDAPPLPECKAQRVVHIVAGTGGFAWFTLVWPVPWVITNYQSGYAYDDPSLAKAIAADVEHPLYVRKVDGARAVWEGTGIQPMPSVFVAGTNQTHTSYPVTMRLSEGDGGYGTGRDVIAAGAAAQSTLGAPLPVLSFRRGSNPAPYQPIPGDPALVHVDSFDEAVSKLYALGALSPALEQELRPDPNELASWVDAAAGQGVADLGAKLLFSANAFRLGLIGTVLIPAFNDDPTGSVPFGTSQAKNVGNGLSHLLDAFYAKLGQTSEAKCSHGGAPLSLSDNVVLIASGDTPKNPFDNSWPDGSLGYPNWIYARTNGYLRTGWFGNVVPTGKTNFDPTSGALSSTTPDGAALNAALLGILHAIVRGDESMVNAVSSAPHGGVVAAVPP